MPEESQCTCFDLLKICAPADFGLAAREAYNTHMKWWRNRNLQKKNVFLQHSSLKRSCNQVIVLFAFAQQVKALEKCVLECQVSPDVVDGIAIQFDTIS